MKNLVVGIIVLLIGIAGPQRQHSSVPSALWALGTLAIMAYLFQQMARRLRLPLLIGWLSAGFLLGTSVLQLVRPDMLIPLPLAYLLTALWVGFQAGIHFSWPRQFTWKVPLAVGLVSLSTLVLAAVGFVLAVELPWWLALLLGAIASFWGLFAILPVYGKRGPLRLGVFGAGWSLLLLSGVLGLLEMRGVLDESVLPLVGYFWLSLIAGALTTGLLQQTGWFAKPGSMQIPHFLILSLGAALLIQQWQLYALPYGFGAGLALTQQPALVQRLRSSLRALQPVAFLLFFALMGATVELHILWPPAPGMLEILLIGLLTSVLVRGLGMITYFSLYSPGRQVRSHLGWLILPRGVLLFELIYHPQHSLLDFLGPVAAQLLHQAALADMLINLLLFSPLILIIQRLFPPRPPALSTGEEMGTTAHP